MGHHYSRDASVCLPDSRHERPLIRLLTILVVRPALPSFRTPLSPTTS